MEIKDFIDTDFIKMPLISDSKEGVIKELISILEENQIVTDTQEVFNKAMEREKKGSTGVGHGVAIPHVKSEAVKKPALAFGISEAGIDFESLDEKPAHLFFLIAVPVKSDDKHLRLLSNLSRKLMHEDFRQSLLSAENRGEVMEVINQE